jgi:hypothetical protein
MSLKNNPQIFVKNNLSQSIRGVSCNNLFTHNLTRDNIRDFETVCDMHALRAHRRAHRRTRRQIRSVGRRRGFLPGPRERGEHLYTKNIHAILQRHFAEYIGDLVRLGKISRPAALHGDDAPLPPVITFTGSIDASSGHTMVSPS